MNFIVQGVLLANLTPTDSLLKNYKLAPLTDKQKKHLDLPQTETYAIWLNGNSATLVSIFCKSLTPKADAIII